MGKNMKKLLTIIQMMYGSVKLIEPVKDAVDGGQKRT